MRREILERVGALPARVVVGHREDLVVVSLLVGHVEDADGTRAHDAAGERRLGDHDQYVERVAVIGEAAFDEPVVARVMHARVEDPIEDEAPAPNTRHPISCRSPSAPRPESD